MRRTNEGLEEIRCRLCNRRCRLLGRGVCSNGIWPVVVDDGLVGDGLSKLYGVSTGEMVAMFRDMKIEGRMQTYAKSRGRGYPI